MTRTRAVRAALLGAALGALGTLYVQHVRECTEGARMMDDFYERLAASLPDDQVYREDS